MRVATYAVQATAVKTTFGTSMECIVWFIFPAINCLKNNSMFLFKRQLAYPGTQAHRLVPAPCPCHSLKPKHDVFCT